MTFDWSEYLKLAQELAGHIASPVSQEAKLRSSVSRAYYAAFCSARNYLSDTEGRMIPSTGQAHVYVRNEFKSSSDRRRKSIGEDLNRLRVRRNKVDYEDSVRGLSSMVIMTLTLAQQVISRVNTL